MTDYDNGTPVTVGFDRDDALTVLAILREENRTAYVNEILDEIHSDRYIARAELPADVWMEIADILENKEESIHGQSFPFWPCRNVRDSIEGRLSLLDNNDRQR